MSSNRKRKALAVLHWARAAQEDEGRMPIPSRAPAPAPPSAADPARFGRGAGGHEGAPWPLDEGE